MSMADVDGAVARELGDRARADVPIGPMTTYRVGGAARWFVAARSLADLVSISRVHAATGVPVLVIGRGSNMLVADSGFDGIAVSLGELTIDGREPIEIDRDRHVARAGGGVALPVLARRTAAAGLAGFEWAVGVPGSVGGAVRMNAGGHGSDMAASVRDVEVFDLRGVGEVEVVPVDQLGLRFRASDLTASQIVVSARLGLTEGDVEQSERTISEIVRWRREHQPGGQNCGSVFVNPVPGRVASGELIDGLGLRGHRIGTAWVSEKHANFIQASEAGTAADVRAVIDDVRARVATATGYHLRTEVRMVGFADVDPASFEPDDMPGDSRCPPGDSR